MKYRVEKKLVTLFKFLLKAIFRNILVFGKAGKNYLLEYMNPSVILSKNIYIKIYYDLAINIFIVTY